jgi:hypothetical protein
MFCGDKEIITAGSLNCWNMVVVPLCSFKEFAVLIKKKNDVLLVLN